MMRRDGSPQLYSRGILSFIFICMASLFFAACAENRVPLVYNSPPESALPAASAPTVCIVTFEDKRPASAIGQRSDNTQFTAESDVRAWFTQALGVEVARLGLVVTRAASEAEAKKSSPQYIVSGSVDEVWITEKLVAEYESRMTVSTLLKGGSSTLLNQRFSNNLSRRLVGPTVPRDILGDTVTDLARTMARALYEKIQR